MKKWGKSPKKFENCSIFLFSGILDSVVNLALTHIDLAISLIIARPYLLIGLMEFFWNHLQTFSTVSIVSELGQNRGVAHIPFETDEFIVPVYLLPIVRAIGELVSSADLRPTVIPFESDFSSVIVILILHLLAYAILNLFHADSGVIHS